MMEMDKRTLIAVVLSVLVLILYQYLIPQQRPPKKEREKKIEKVIPQEVKELPHQKRPPVKEMIPLPVEVVEEKEVYIETDLYKAILTNRGGVIKSWELKRYTDKYKKPVQLLRAKGPSIMPLSILPQDGDIGERILRGNYRVDKERVILGKDRDKDRVILTYQDPSGVFFRKTLTFYNNDYKVDLKIETDGINGPYTISLGQDFGIFDEKEGGHVGPVSKINGRNITDKRGKIKEPLSYKGNIVWAALEDKYFTAAMVPMTTVGEVIVEKVGETVAVGLKITQNEARLMLYAGPKEYDRLKALHVSLEDIIDYGWFSALAKPLFWILKLFYNFLKNYGLAIILLTILIRIIFIPLTNKSQKSMKAMQALAPKINEIREKYKKDPQRMNKEVMELYKRHKVNPMGGCLPMILQIPVFIALYNVLMYAIELRGAPFLLWIKDLSTKDPYYILPITMGISMVVQQKMTPTSADPMQSKIMMFLPIIFTFMFLGLPSGLVLYWLVNNLLSIAQQYYINKKMS